MSIPGEGEGLHTVPEGQRELLSPLSSWWNDQEMQATGGQASQQPRNHWIASWRKPWGWELDLPEGVGERVSEPRITKGRGVDIYIKLTTASQDLLNLWGNKESLPSTTLRTSGLPNKQWGISPRHDLWYSSKRPGLPGGSYKLICTQQPPHPTPLHSTPPHPTWPLAHPRAAIPGSDLTLGTRPPSNDTLP